MTNATKVLFLLVGLIACGVQVGQCQRLGCFDRFESGPVNCDTGNCLGEYYNLYCTFGCVHGYCYDQGGSSYCCDTFYYTATLYPDGDKCVSECGEAPQSAARAVASKVASKHKIASKYKITGSIVGPKGSAYVPARVSFVPDSCGQVYAMVIQHGVVIHGGI